MTRAELVALAFGPDAVVDHAVPQQVFDGLTDAQRGDIAGWLYSGDGQPPLLFGRLLTQTECWQAIRTRVEDGALLVVSPTDWAESARLLTRSPADADAAAEWAIDAAIAERKGQ